MVRIPEMVVEQIKDANDIVDVIGSYLQLTKKGQNYWARCPFHDEKTGSFSVSASKQIYHCFGCGAGGNVLSFVMEYEKLSFFESVKLLAERANIPLEMETEDTADKSEIGQLADVQSAAADWFQQNLKTKTHASALDYLKKRGISNITIQQFKLGYAETGWDSLLNELKRRKFPPPLLKKSGFFVESEAGKVFDRFRNRVMFPVWDLRGRIVGFGGRTLSDDKNEAKYLNSPETPLYHKGKILYGLYQSQDAIRKSKTALIVEGYMDYLQLWQAGFHHVVAGSGTAFTEDHARILSRTANDLILCYDSDTAGQNAAYKTAFLFTSQKIHCRILQLPAGEDPDSFLKSNGTEAFQEKLDTSLPFKEFLRNYYQPDKMNASRQTEAIHNILEHVRNFTDSLHREIFLRDISEIFNVSLNNLVSQLQRRQSPVSTKKEDTIQAAKEFKKPGDAARYQLLQILLATEPRIRNAAIEYLSPEIFNYPLMIQTGQYLLESFRQNIHLDAHQIIAGCSDQKMRGFLSRLWMESDGITNPEPSFLDCMQRIEEAMIDEKVKSVEEELRKAGHDMDRIFSLQTKHQALFKRRKELADVYTSELFDIEKK